MSLTCSVCGSKAVRWQPSGKRTECAYCGATDCEKRQPGAGRATSLDSVEYGAGSLADEFGPPPNESERQAWARLKREGRA